MRSARWPPTSCRAWVPHEQLMAATEDLVTRICAMIDGAVESAKENDPRGDRAPARRPSFKLEALLGYAICGQNPAIRRTIGGVLRQDRQGRVGKTAPPRL